MTKYEKEEIHKEKKKPSDCSEKGTPKMYSSDSPFLKGEKNIYSSLLLG